MIKSIDITYDLNPLRTNMDRSILDNIIFDIYIDMDSLLDLPVVAITETEIVSSLGLTWNDVFSDYPLVV